MKLLLTKLTLEGSLDWVSHFIYFIYWSATFSLKWHVTNSQLKVFLPVYMCHYCTCLTYSSLIYIKMTCHITDTWTVSHLYVSFHVFYRHIYFEIIYYNSDTWRVPHLYILLCFTDTLQTVSNDLSQYCNDTLKAFHLYVSFHVYYRYIWLEMTYHTKQWHVNGYWPECITSCDAQFDLVQDDLSTNWQSIGILHKCLISWTFRWLLV